MNYVFFIARPILFKVLLFCIYYYYGYANNEYMGYKQLELDFYFFIGVVISFVWYFLVFSKSLYRPSDFFILFYSYIVLFSYVVLHGVWGRTGITYVYDLFVLLVPLIVIVLIRDFKLKLPVVYIVKDFYLILFFLIFSFIIILFLLVNQPSSSSFELQSSYVRRLEARGLYGSVNFISYSSSIVMNGLLPFFIFMGVMSRRFSLVLFSLAFYVVFYYLYGVKAPLLYMVVAGVLALYIKANRLRSFFDSFYYILIFVFLISIIELVVFEYSYLEDYLIRRVFYVGSYLVGAYLEMFGSSEFDLVFGITDAVSASMYMGEVFLNDPGLNANTNTFLYFLIQWGVIGYCLVILLVGLIFSFFDSICDRSYVYFYLAFIYSLLIIEQSATTALLSSGVGVIVIMYYFFKPDLSLKVFE